VNLKDCSIFDSAPPESVMVRSSMYLNPNVPQSLFTAMNKRDAWSAMHCVPGASYWAEFCQTCSHPGADPVAQAAKLVGDYISTLQDVERKKRESWMLT
jgi:hypothetical protein